MNDKDYTQEGVEPASHDSADRPEASEASDGQLLAAIARGDDSAFASFYQKHAPAVFNYLLRLIHDHGQAEDLLQETFVAVWRGAGTFKRQSKVTTWLFRIAHNRAVSWLRRHRPQSLDDDPEIPDKAPGPEIVAVINWRNEALRNALDELSPNHRAVIELTFVQELAYAEIAQIMDCPLGTVKSRMSYALKHLNRLLVNDDLG